MADEEVKLDEASQQKVKRQIEFYFSDSNLPRDAFLLERVQSTEDGMVDLATVCAFKRMRALLNSNAADEKNVPAALVKAVADVLRNSDSLTVSEDGQRIKRTVPMASPQEILQGMDARSLYAAPFPFDVSLDAITDFFSNVAPVNCVRMRRFLATKDFKGSVFVEFATPEAMEEVLVKELEFAGAPLRLERKAEYVGRKTSERHAKPNSPANKEANGTGAAAAAANGTAEGGAEEGVGGAEEGGEEGGAAAPAQQQAVEVPRGVLLKVKFEEEGVGKEDVQWTDIQMAFGGRDQGVKHVAWGHSDLAAGEAQVRFDTAEQAQAALALAGEGGALTIADKAAVVSAIEGEEEDALRQQIAERMRNTAENGGGGRGRGGHGGRGGGRGGRGGRGFRGGRGGRGRGGRGRGQKRNRDD